jgi:hypothetical protein
MGESEAQEKTEQKQKIDRTSANNKRGTAHLSYYVDRAGRLLLTTFGALRSESMSNLVKRDKDQAQFGTR